MADSNSVVTCFAEVKYSNRPCQVDWPKGNSNPLSCGEGGGGQGLGSSGHMFMAHHEHWYTSADGGLNFLTGTAPGTPGGGFDYARTAGSRTEPSGTVRARRGV
jgi:hypothetical protein